jgi:RimJ/RimL family protein N-acetyltransferase
VVAGKDDVGQVMFGDINVFFSEKTDAEEDEDRKAKSDKKKLIGEINLMLAVPATRRNGFGMEALKAMLAYVVRNSQILGEEYNSGLEDAIKEECEIDGFVAKIDKDNYPSIGLFAAAGFVKVREEANYFGEFEMVLDAKDVDVDSEETCQTRKYDEAD